ncbi:MAG: cell division protein FtsQ/DivIB [Actinomycetota bacterium]
MTALPAPASGQAATSGTAEIPKQARSTRPAAGIRPHGTAAPASAAGKSAAGKSVPASTPRRGAAADLLARWRGLRPGPSQPSDAAEPDTTVVSFPEPPRRKTRRRLLIAAGTVVVLIAVLMSVIFLSPALAVKTITVEGADLTDSATLSEALEPLKGIPLARVGEREVAAQVDHFPAVESVEVVAKPPSELHVRIIERTPVAVLKDGKKFVLIDESGKALASVRKRSEAKLPLIDGAKAAEDPDVFASITGVLGALQPEVLKQLDHASARSVDSVELQLANGQKVLWGNAGQQELKATVLQALLEAKGVKGKASVIDVSTPTRPVTR